VRLDFVAAMRDHGTVEKPFARGELWVAAQVLVLAGHLVLALRFARPSLLALSVAGAVVLTLGAGFLGVSMIQLGGNLTPNPRPLEGAHLVTTGVYSVVRHPIYLGLIVLCLGLTLVTQSVPSAVSEVLVLGFFHLKADREERWLRATYPEYATYADRVRKLIPWLF
jgi:protein-S-isoprenylcysteine O-methyltransferase Ste14